MDRGTGSVQGLQKTRVRFDLNTRFDLDGFDTAARIPELSVIYKFKKWISVRVGYRFAQLRNRFNDFEDWQRVFGDVRLKKKWKKIRVAGRLRYQHQWTDFFGRQDRNTLRTRLQVGYDTDRFLEPVVGAEIFYRFGGRFGTGLHKNRYMLGAEANLKKLTKGLSAEIFYGFEQPVADDNDPPTHIWSLSIRYNIYLGGPNLGCPMLVSLLREGFLCNVQGCWCPSYCPTFATLGVRNSLGLRNRLFSEAEASRWGVRFTCAIDAAQAAAQEPSRSIGGAISRGVPVGGRRGVQSRKSGACRFERGPFGSQIDRYRRQDRLGSQASRGRPRSHG